MNLDPTKNSKDFEHFCKWIARDNFGPNVFLYSKYNQNGIDIYWTNKCKYHVVQCKQRKDPFPSELIRSLEEDFDRAKKHFKNDLAEFIFASTASLELIETKIPRNNNQEESVLDVCKRLSASNDVEVIPWHWNYLNERVSESPFLQRHLLNREDGADLIDDDFIRDHTSPYDGIGERQSKLEYYGGQEDIQWYGILKNLDAPRDKYDSLVQSISSSFNRAEPVAAVIRGEGGSGKSVLLRRLAFDLRDEYSVYWLRNNIEAFLNNEFVYDVQKHAESKYIVILEDWYRNVERSANTSSASQLLSDIKGQPNVRLVIGDRKEKRTKIYTDYVLSRHTCDLENFENRSLLEGIFTKMPEWRDLISESELKEISNATLFIALFAFCYAEQDDNESLTDRYRRIFLTDYSRLMDEGTFEQGLANSLHLYANLYSKYGVTLSLPTLMEWACYYNGASIPPVYRSDNTRLLKHPVVKKYLHLESIQTRSFGTIQKVRFHHDTMAEQGWAQKHPFIDFEFDENTIGDLINILTKNKHEFDRSLLYYRLSKRPGEKGKKSAREYLGTERPDKNHIAFSYTLTLLKGEEIAKKAARDFLEKTKNAHENHSAFCSSFDLLKGDKDGEKIAKKKAIAFLKTKNPYVNYWAFCASLDLLKGDKDGEKIAKKKAIAFLNTKNPHENHSAFCSSLVLLDTEAEGTALKIVENHAHERWSFVFHSLGILGRTNKHNGLLSRVVTEIIDDKRHDRFKREKLFKYKELLKIPLFNIPIWQYETESLIRTWKAQIGYKRNYLRSITYSYVEFPERLKEMSMGIIRNWRNELTAKTKHKAYFTRCLANVGVTGDETEKAEVIAICKEICDLHRHKPLNLTPNLEEWIEKIAAGGEFPSWKMEG